MIENKSTLLRMVLTNQMYYPNIASVFMTMTGIVLYLGVILHTFNPFHKSLSNHNVTREETVNEIWA